MRAFLVLLLLSAVPAGCTPYIPVKDDFGTSALAPAAGSRSYAAIPPEFAAFNDYDPAVNRLVADQICATPYQPLDARTLGALPGSVIEARGRCQTHVPLFGQ